MVREAKPPVVPPRPDKLRPQPRPRSSAPSPPSSPLIPANSPPSIYSQQTSAVISPNIGTLQQDKPTKKKTKDKSAEEDVTVEKVPSRPSSGKQAAVQFTSSTAGGSRSPSLGPILFVIEKSRKESAVERPAKGPTTREKTPTPSQVSSRRPVASEKSTSESKGKQKEKEVKGGKATKLDDTQRAVSVAKPKSVPSTEIARSTRSQASKARVSSVSVSDVQSLIRSNHSSRSGTSTVQRLQQRQDVYRTHTSSAEARALYAEAKDHYGKAKNHLQEALKLSVDVFRLAPHALVENIVTKEIRPKNTNVAPAASLVNANKGVRYAPEYPGLGIQYRSLFTPLLGNASSAEKERKQALEKKRADDALAQEHLAAVKYTGAKSSVAGSSRGSRSNTTTRSVPTRAPIPPPVPSPPSVSVSASATSRAASQRNRQRTKRRSAPVVPSRPASVSTRTAARMRDNYELRPRTRTRSAGSRRLRKRSQEEVDHGILWFFSY